MKIRIQDYQNEIETFLANMRENKNLKIRSISKEYDNRGGEEKRVYVEIDNIAP